jgi:hypothetical protein
LTNSIAVDEFGRDPLAFVDQVATGRVGLVITRDGSRVVALVNMRDFGIIERMRTRLDELCDGLGQAFADLPEEEGPRSMSASSTCSAPALPSCLSLCNAICALRLGRNP